MNHREAFGQKYGKGATAALEIGAQRNPWPLPIRARYVDNRGREAFLADGEKGLVTPDLIEDGNTLPSFMPATYDLVCASHVLEHMRDPIGALRRWVELLKPGGAVLGAVPEKPRMFDFNRDVTPYALLKAVHEGGPAAVQAFMACQRADWHFRYGGESWSKAVQRAVLDAGTPKDVHFSVWDWQSLHVFLTNTLRDYLPDTDLADFVMNDKEVLFVLRRRP